jgi:hypothetical protein
LAGVPARLVDLAALAGVFVSLALASVLALMGVRDRDLGVAFLPEAGVASFSVDFLPDRGVRNGVASLLRGVRGTIAALFKNTLKDERIKRRLYGISAV